MELDRKWLDISKPLAKSSVVRPFRVTSTRTNDLVALNFDYGTIPLIFSHLSHAPAIDNTTARACRDSPNATKRLPGRVLMSKWVLVFPGTPIPNLFTEAAALHLLNTVPHLHEVLNHNTRLLGDGPWQHNLRAVFDMGGLGALI